MTISAINSANYHANGRQPYGEMAAPINVDNAFRRLAYLDTEANPKHKRNNRITNALFYAAPAAMALETAAFAKPVSNLFGNKLTGVAARAVNGLKVGMGAAAIIGAIQLAGFAHDKLADKSSDVRKFDKQHPILSTAMTGLAALGGILLLDKGITKLASKEAPKFLKNGTESVAKFLNNNKYMVSMKNGIKKVAEKTPSALKEFGATALNWAPSALLFGGLIHSIHSSNEKKADFFENYANLKDNYEQLLTASNISLAMQNDLLMQDAKNREDMKIMQNPLADMPEEVVEKVEALHDEVQNVEAQNDEIINVEEA